MMNFKGFGYDCCKAAASDRVMLLLLFLVDAATAAAADTANAGKASAVLKAVAVHCLDGVTDVVWELVSE